MIFLESMDSDYDTIKDIFTELEDEFGLVIDYDDRVDDDILCMMDIRGHLDRNRNNDLVDFIHLLCGKVKELTGYPCDFQLTFKLTEDDIIFITKINDVVKYSNQIGRLSNPIHIDRVDLGDRDLAYFYIWVYRS